MELITAELVESGERRDSRGRKLAGDARRTAVLAAYDRSGLTQRKFAQQEGVKYHTLVTWLVRRRRGSRAAAAPRVRFAEVRVPAGLRVGLEVCLPGGLTVRGHDAGQVAALVRALR